MTIRKATKKDIEEVISWLHTEYKLKGECPFYKNREQLRNPYGNPVVLEIKGKVIGLMIHGIDTIHYFVIHRHFRGKGYGKRLFRYKERICKKAKQGTVCLLVQPFPSTSLPFWNKMGFIYDYLIGDAFKYY